MSRSIGFGKTGGCLVTLFAVFTLSGTSTAGEPIGEGSVKFLGNISTALPPSNFADYWNQVTLENAGKWGSVQGSSQSSFNWKPVDEAYDYCKEKGFPYKQHCFVWGSQYPSWITSLSKDKQLEAVETWIKTFGERYPETDFIDVVNEPLTTSCPFKNGLGGDGTTGWDWIVTSFELARKYCPDAKLLINEYNVEGNLGNAVKYLKIVNILKEKNLIDGIGLQSHCFNLEGTQVATLKQCIDTLASAGLPLYSSEFDLTGDENTQLKRYQTYFPVFWEHPAVKGVTLWGWTSNWRNGIIMSGTKEYAALKWLRTYVDSLERVGTVVSAAHISEVRPAVSLTAGIGGLVVNVSAEQTFSVTMFSPAGRVVYSLPRQFFQEGSHTVSWRSGMSPAQGTYITVVNGPAGNSAQTVVLKK